MEIGTMDIALYATNQAQAKLMSDVGTAVLSKAIDNQEIESAGLMKLMGSASAAMMERSVNPHIGGNIDLSI